MKEPWPYTHCSLYVWCQYVSLSEEWVAASRTRTASYQPQAVTNGLTFICLHGWREGSSVSTDLNLYGKSDYSLNFNNTLKNLEFWNEREHVNYCKFTV